MSKIIGAFYNRGNTRYQDRDKSIGIQGYGTFCYSTDMSDEQLKCLRNIIYDAMNVLEKTGNPVFHGAWRNDFAMLHFSALPYKGDRDGRFVMNVGMQIEDYKSILDFLEKPDYKDCMNLTNNNFLSTTFTYEKLWANSREEYMYDNEERSSAEPFGKTELYSPSCCGKRAHSDSE